MKALRITGNILIGIVLFGLIFSLSLIISSKSFFENDLVMGLVKNSIIETIREKSNNLTKEKKIAIDEIFDDKDTSELVHIFVENFRKYQSDQTHFSVSDSDTEKISSFAFKYKKQIKIITNDSSDLTDEKYKEIFSKENIDQVANRLYEELNTDTDDSINTVIDIYKSASSGNLIIILGISILILIVLLGLINWSFFKWMIVVGIALIISGIFMCFVYLICALFMEAIGSVEWLNEIASDISFMMYLIVGILEILVGIILIIIYNTIRNKPFNEQINNLGVGD